MNVQSSTAAWQDTGVVLCCGYSLTAAAAGNVYYDVSNGNQTGVDGIGQAADGTFAAHGTDPVRGIALQQMACVLLLYPNGATPPPPPDIYDLLPPAGGASQGSRVLMPGSGTTYSSSVLQSLCPDICSQPYRVWAIMNDNRYEDNSGPFTLSLTRTAVPPPAPANLRDPGVCEGPQVTLLWDAVACAAAYRVYQDGVALTPNVLAPTTTKVVTGLLIGTTYTFTVSAIDRCGLEGPQSAPLSVTPCNSPTPPDAPTLLGQQGCEGGCRVTVRWTPAGTGGAATQFRVYENGVLLATLATPAAQYLADGLTEGRQYAFSVIASNVVGDSPASNTEVYIPCCALWEMADGACTSDWRPAGAAPSTVWRKPCCCGE